MAEIFPALSKQEGYDRTLLSCIQETIQKLLSTDTSADHPGMLLGKIQSGKTRTFIGVMGLAFDQGYELIIVLTKGTQALAQQTYQRLDKVFETFIEDDVVKLYDIMNIPEELTPYIRSQKIILIAKKETHNLDRIVALFKKHPDLGEKKLLFIDDEADYASVGFRKDSSQMDDVSVNTLATKIDKLRKFGSRTSFLQVTATPYSLYLQPEAFVVNNVEYHPIRPVFTQLVPIHNKYVGGEFYFEQSEDPNSSAFFLHKDVPQRELQILGRPDQRYISNVLTTPNLSVFRSAMINFLVAGAIRRLQEKPKNYKCSFIIHTEISKDKHSWQTRLVTALIEGLTTWARNEPRLLQDLISDSYHDFTPSVPPSSLPEENHVIETVTKALLQGYVGICKINSDQQIAALLDKKGQLRLDNPYNIFIGGQILDRGITIDNLIGFFYGRNPQRFQQDTVLQHSRMYGSRSPEDLCVTRFYTSARIYHAMRRMHEFDSGLREAFERGEHEDGVVFLLKDDSGQVRHCAPTKILISSTETIRPYRRFLPRGMQTKSPTVVSKINEKIEERLATFSNNAKEGDPFLMTWEHAAEILRLIEQSYEFSERWDNLEYKWDVSTFIAVLRKVCSAPQHPQLDGKTFCVFKSNRNISRYKAQITFTDAPDDGQTDRPQARGLAIDIPCLQLFHQQGLEKNGWRDVPFFWPVLVCPRNTQTAVFAAEEL
jgi:Z1 domain-containing protein